MYSVNPVYIKAPAGELQIRANGGDEASIVLPNPPFVIA